MGYLRPPTEGICGSRSPFRSPSHQTKSFYTTCKKGAFPGHAVPLKGLGRPPAASTVDELRTFQCFLVARVVFYDRIDLVGVDGYYLLWPLGDAKENLILTSHIAVLGGFVFLVGAYFGVLEAIYAEREGNFEIASEWVLISTSTLLGSVIHHIQLGSLDEGPNKMVSTKSTKPEWKWWSLELNTIAKKAGMTQFAGA
eukprot:CAMPEP_0183719726 /NCGR_PEP_ID=MMETSP0737-20130205/12547_1 /TAXON_ID=385413 /ORGANISM="Thalassiosira miniscula, Strain CCMP1093" /LENGTH=197 /DNA_ID=CAMNT_0025949463 /DNA_START=144 /DNA_END=734 /DNA_ORIENTATION=-